MRGATPTLVEQPKARCRPLPTVEPRQSRARPANGPLTCGRTKETHAGRLVRTALFVARRPARTTFTTAQERRADVVRRGWYEAGQSTPPGACCPDRNFSVWPPAAARTSAPSWGQVKFVTIIIIVRIAKVSGRRLCTIIGVLKRTKIFLQNKYPQTGAEQDSDGSQRRTSQQLTPQAQGNNIQPIRSTGAPT